MRRRGTWEGQKGQVGIGTEGVRGSIIYLGFECGICLLLFFFEGNGREDPYLFFSIFIFCKEQLYRAKVQVHKCTKGKVQGFQSPKTKRSKNYKRLSLHTNKGSEIVFSTLMQTWPRSSLRAALQSNRVAVWL
jgi:hypothetical protein